MTNRDLLFFDADEQQHHRALDSQGTSPASINDQKGTLAHSKNNQFATDVLHSFVNFFIGKWIAAAAPGTTTPATVSSYP
ncbi:unnamed protein product [Absidia cylindrospora]